MSEERRSTTAPLWRPPIFLALVALALWFFGGFVVSLSTVGVLPELDAAAWARLSWPSHFRMFTDLRAEHGQLLVEWRYQGQTTIVDLKELYPMRWQAGPGYQQRHYIRDTARLGELAAATCRRMEPQAGELRITLERWPKTPGQKEQPREGLKQELLVALQCSGVQ